MPTPTSKHDDDHPRTPPVIAVGHRHRLDPEATETLIDCEQHGVPSVVWATSVQDLDSATAAVVTHVAVGERALHREAIARFGPERALLAHGPEDAVQQVTDMTSGDRQPGAQEVAAVRRWGSAVAAGVRRGAGRAVRTARAWLGSSRSR